TDDCDTAMNRRRNLPGKAKAQERIRGSVRSQQIRTSEIEVSTEYG
ncbi:MAG: hypothetical protein QOE21_944, partial [Microbacteriaceae bacterium]|nr:hypothetical protein [Microbacteriaceae bacterium]